MTGGSSDPPTHHALKTERGFKTEHGYKRVVRETTYSKQTTSSNARVMLAGMRILAAFRAGKFPPDRYGFPPPRRLPQE